MIPKIGIVIQARTGSTRMAEKVLKYFHSGSTILDIIIEKAKLSELPVVLATSTKPEDAQLELYSKKHQISFFQGDEQNVLQRFIDAATVNSFDVIIRVCADNPFIYVPYISDLIKAYKESPAEYINFFDADGNPVIKSHYGFFAELVELKALKKVSTLTSDSLFLEHVTNYIYSNSAQFSLKKLNLPFSDETAIRLTIDTEEDFETVAYLYEKYNKLTPKELIDKIKSNKDMVENMREQIIRNTK